MSKSQKMLVIDDEAANRFLVEAILKSLRYTLKFAESGLDSPKSVADCSEDNCTRSIDPVFGMEIVLNKEF